MKKALITGGIGFIGFHLSMRLLAEGYEVTACDSGFRGSVDRHVNALRNNDRYRLICGDLMDDRCLDEISRKYTHIFHMAAIVGVKNVVEKPYDVLKNNALCLMRVIDVARRQRDLQRLVFPSTSEVYAGTQQYFGMEFPTRETTPLTVGELRQPRTSYMLSKIYGEALCHQAGIPFTIVRPHNIYGPRMGMSHVIPELLERAHYCPAGGTLRVFSPGHSRTFCFVDDAINLIVGVATSPAGLSETFNIGTSAEETSMAALARLVITTVGKPLGVECGPETQGSPPRRQPDVSQAVSVASCTPSVSLVEGVRRTYEWYQDNVFATAPSGSSAVATVAV
jgi:nucleoside-diphosphate-sugar epimerase